MPDTPFPNRRRPAPSPVARPRGPQATRCARDLASVAYEAFCATHRTVYSRYAAARLGNDRLGEDAAQAALGALAPLWASALTCPAPAAVSWLLLTGFVNAQPRVGREPARGLSQIHADAVILHDRLGLPRRTAAAVMGLPPQQFDMVHNAALRATQENTEKT
ncbi:hypothetical protein ACIQWR_38805 [Streptomyces sp. NPDC098789]|uniref:hypothetical protein n=1 Tax=Streptomyces sp. NPDC098789 TaxID=3366098 RepID=UPI003807A42F